MAHWFLSKQLICIPICILYNRLPLLGTLKRKTNYWYFHYLEISDFTGNSFEVYIQYTWNRCACGRDDIVLLFQTGEKKNNLSLIRCDNIIYYTFLRCAKILEFSRVSGKASILYILYVYTTTRTWTYHVLSLRTVFVVIFKGD